MTGARFDLNGERYQPELELPVSEEERRRIVASGTLPATLALDMPGASVRAYPLTIGVC